MSEKTLTITLELTEIDLELLHEALASKIYRAEKLDFYPLAQATRVIVTKLVAAQAVAGEWKEPKA